MNGTERRLVDDEGGSQSNCDSYVNALAVACVVESTKYKEKKDDLM